VKCRCSTRAPDFNASLAELNTMPSRSARCAPIEQQAEVGPIPEQSLVDYPLAAVRPGSEALCEDGQAVGTDRGLAASGDVWSGSNGGRVEPCRGYRREPAGRHASITTTLDVRRWASDAARVHRALSVRPLA
jgi:hypothetical protein